MEINKTKKFNKISIGLASPETMLASSRGEVLKPETINYRTHKPERDGLFCERIFGPVKDYECACGKYKRIRYKGIVCDRCGVEVTEKKVRRDRVGHINLVVPVAHIWYFRSLPNKIGYLLGLPTKKLDMIIYYERYVVVQPGLAVDAEGNPLNKMDFLTEEEYLNIMETLPAENQFLEDSDPNKFIAKMGAEALHDLLANLDLDELSYNLRNTAANETSQQTQSIDTTASIVTETFQAEEKILPDETPDKQYKFATSFLKVGDYSTAERAFREFVNTNPEHNLAGNAQYWYAETFRIRQLYTDAASAYLEGYQKYPKGEKAPINLLKLGVSMVQIGEKDQGCKMINGVEKQYPNACLLYTSDAADE